MLSKQYFEDIEKSVRDLMSRFRDDTPITEEDRRNFELLHQVEKQFMISLVKGDFRSEDDNDFLRNFRRDFDNIYGEGLPEAIIISLKRGKRTELSREWWNGFDGHLGKWKWNKDWGPDPTVWSSSD